jgi:hypothetical protein
VYQVKFVKRPLAEPDPHKWLTGIIEDEAPKIKNLIPRGAKQTTTTSQRDMGKVGEKAHSGPAN